MSLRTAAVQFGYLCGAAVGGAMLALTDYGGVGIAFALLYIPAAIPHLGPVLGERSPRLTRVSEATTR